MHPYASMQAPHLAHHLLVAVEPRAVKVAVAHLQRAPAATHGQQARAEQA